jgi:hypothetical protein
MRNILTAAALLVFVVSSGLLEMTKDRHRPITDLPPTFALDAPAVSLDATAVTSAVR